MEGLLKDIESMDYFQTSNMLRSVGDIDISVNRILTNRIKHLTSISSSYEQYVNDMNLIKSVANEEIEKGNYEEAINVFKSAYHEFNYVELLYYIGKMYYKLHKTNRSTEYFRRYIIFGGYLKLDKVMHYLALNYINCNPYESQNFYKTSKKYSLLYGHTFTDKRFEN